ncbi:right-handed parallel beta-helix repeat-containing protein [Dyella subtropica]|uniref:right-handed parallel beta-helix repeat-containing protein n=1 Tax=Dyella subtropica TaxID=2992127 RepID=UPI002252C57C|nr:right-handed parallel beta-helix repeat-containing protein [Dyella subtropica]
MKRFLKLLLASCVIALAFSAVAQAQATRTWTSGVGDDANPCSRTAPCKTFAGAFSKTAVGGEISVLDPGGFGAVTITHGLMINGGGELASVLVSGGTAVVVNAGPSDTVILRNLEFNGLGVGLNGVGIMFTGGGTLIIDHCTFQGFTQSAVDIALTGSGSVVIRDSTIIGGATGVKVESTATGVVASLKNVAIQGTGTALDAKAGILEATNSMFQRNTSYGALAEGGTINLESSYFSGNGVAVQAQTGSSVRISNVDMFNNAGGIVANGTVNSAGNNRKIGNTVPGAPSGTIAVQ